MPTEQITDLTIVAVYLIAVTFVGIWIGRKNAKTQEGYFLGNRQFNWVMIGFSLFATNVGMGMFVGGTGKAYQIGIAAVTPELFGGLGLTISAIVFIPLYLRSNITTLPQFLERRFATPAKLLYGSAFVALAIITSPLTMYTGSIATLTLFNFEINATNIWLASLAIASTVGLYSVLGGLTAVVITDMIQVIVMVIGALLVAIIGLITVGGPNEFFTSLPEDNLELLRPIDDPHFPWHAMVTGQLLASCLWAFSNITMLQRVLGAKELENAQKGMLVGAGMKMFALILFVIPGMIAAQLYPGINPDTAYSELTRNLLPVGLSGLVLAGMIAALMSSADSGINALASIVAIDIYPRIRKNATQRQGVLVGKSIAIMNILWGVAAAPIFMTINQGIFDLALKFGGFLMMPNGLCYLLGRFWKRGTHQACVTTLACGISLGLFYNFTSTIPGYDYLLPQFILNIHYYFLLALFAGILTTVFVVVSLLTPAPTEDQLALLKLNKPLPEEEQLSAKPFYRRFGFWAIIYLTAFFALYIIF
ncbi:MAG: sodium/solute symporter [Verrucomicrobiota bacterium]